MWLIKTRTNSHLWSCTCAEPCKSNSHMLVNVESDLSEVQRHLLFDITDQHKYSSHTHTHAHTSRHTHTEEAIQHELL